MNTIRFSELNCDGCPARPLLDITRSRAIEAMRIHELKRLNERPRTLLLCESAPVDRFVYDITSNYDHNGLRFNLREELTQDKTDESLFKILKSQRLWIVDGALCPLHKGRLLTNSQRRKAATLCIERHTHSYLDAFPEAKLYTAFPKNCGFLKRQLPHLANRVAHAFGFNVVGLKKQLETDHNT